MVISCDLPSGFEDGAIGAIIVAIAWIIKHFVSRKETPIR